MEDERKLQVLFLASVTRKYLPSSHIKLRSYYSSHLLSVANFFRVKLPKNVTNRTAACPYCCFPWSHDTASIKLIPGKKIKNKKLRVEVANDGSVQQRNKLVVKCKVCNQKSPFSLVKKTKKPISNKETIIEEVKKSKKKRKKDKTCGLKKSAINQVKQKTEPQTGHEKSISKQNSSPDKISIESFSDEFVVLKKDSSKAHKLKKGSVKPSKGPNKGFPNKNLAPNPFATKIQDKLSKKDKKKLQMLRKAVKSDKSVVKNTLKDFLSLVSK